MPKPDVLWGTRSPGQVALVERGGPFDPGGGTAVLYDPTGRIDWLRLPSDSVLGEWGAQSVRVLRTEKRSYCAAADHLALWHWTEAPFIVIECPQCGQFQVAHKPDNAKEKTT